MLLWRCWSGCTLDRAHKFFSAKVKNLQLHFYTMADYFDSQMLTGAATSAAFAGAIGYFGGAYFAKMLGMGASSPAGYAVVAAASSLVGSYVTPMVMGYAGGMMA
jgi:hypothetical protein